MTEENLKDTPALGWNEQQVTKELSSPQVSREVAQSMSYPLDTVLCLPGGSMTTAAETAQYEAAVTEFSKVALTVPNEQRERFFHMIKEMTRAIRQARWRADVIAAATRGCE